MKMLSIAVALVLFVACAGIGRADTILGTEDTVSGFVGTIPGTLVHVASDGESQFFPFGITVDTTDALNLNDQVAAGNPWAQDPASAWTQQPGTNVYFIPE